MGGGASSRKKGASNKITAVQAFAGAKKLPAKAAANWFEALKYVASQDVWKGVKREDRPEWNKYLTQAEEIMRKPRQSLSKVHVYFCIISHIRGYIREFINLRRLHVHVVTLQ